MRGMDKRILSTAPNCPIVESVPRQGIRRGETLGQERHSGRTTRKTNPKIKPCEISEQSTIYVPLSLSKSVARNSIRDRHPAWIFAISHNFTQNGETEKSPNGQGITGGNLNGNLFSEKQRSATNRICRWVIPVYCGVYEKRRIFQYEE